MAEKDSSILVAVFTEMQQAQYAYDDLRRAGYGDDYLGIADPGPENNGVGKELVDAGVPEADSQFYEREFNQGHPLVTLRVGGLQPDSVQKAINILKLHGAYDANSSPGSQRDFASNVRRDARSPFFDIKPGVAESE
jgi:hypothetical protein